MLLEQSLYIFIGFRHNMEPGLNLLLSTLIAYLCAQAIKALIGARQGFSFKRFFSYGRMPSGHAATASAFATGVYILQGPSLLFAFCVFFAFIISSDAVKFRRPAGLTAAAVNRAHNAGLQESLGHTFPQVAAGLLLGILVAIILML
jgi:uncharacterized protein